MNPVPTATSSLLWGAGLAWFVPTMSAMGLVHHVVPADRADGVTRFIAKVQIALTGSRVERHVHSDISESQPYMFVQNHVNHFDYATMYPSTRHYKQGLEHEDHFRYPLYGWFMRTRGSIPVPREPKGRSSLIAARMREEVEQGRSLLVFPEGTRTRTGHVGPFRRGVFRIARDIGVPIVPVAVTGMYEVMNAHSWHIRPGGRVTVHLDKPHPTADLSDAETDALAESVRGIISQRVEAYYQDA